MKTMLVMLLSLALAACGTTQTRVIKQYEVVEKVQLKTVDIDRYLLEDCRVSQPPERSAYLSANRDQKEAMMVQFSSELIADLKFCNMNLEAVRKSLDLQEEVVKKYNDQEAARVKALLNQPKEPLNEQRN